MFKKKSCKRCGKKVDNKYDFCPYCGNPINEDKGDWGMLGKNDFIPSNELGLPKGFNMIFNSLMKNMSKQFNEMNKLDKNPKKPIKKNGISISISTSNNGSPKIRVKSFGNNNIQNQAQKQKPQPKKNFSKSFSQKNAKKFSSLPREEPKTNIRRFSDKVIYEIEVPDVNSIEDVSITKLENSIEIRAITKDKAYFKLIPINLPITNYNLKEGKLILELDSQS